MSRLAEGTQVLGSSALDAFRSIDRVGAAMSGLTGAATVAGMGALVNRWSELGQSAANVSQRLAIPVTTLTELQGAARLAGVSAEDATSGISGLRDSLRGATFRGDIAAQQAFNALGVNFGEIGKSAASAEDSLGPVADGIKRIYNSGKAGPGIATQILQTLHMEGLEPLLLRGAKGVADLRAETAKLGGAITPEMAKNATELHTSLERVGIAFEGIENRLGDKWGKAITPYLDKVSEWIGANKGVADSYTAIGTSILALGAIKPAARLARLLGIGAVAPYAPLLAPLAIPGDTNPNATPGGFIPGWRPDMGTPGTPYTGPTETFGGMLHREWNTWAPSWLGGGASANRVGESLMRAGRIGLPPLASPANAVMRSGFDFWTSHGLSPAQAAGVLANEAGESSFDPENTTDDSFGLYQVRQTRLTALRAFAGTDHPTAEQQREFALHELQTSEGAAYRALLAAKTPEEAALAFTGFERPKYWNSFADPGVHAQERAAAAPAILQQVSGSVDVHVKLSGAPPGTTATTTTSGPVRATPLQVIPAMPGY